MKSDTAGLVQRLKRLFVPIISDTLDELGITANTFSPDVRPIFPKVKVAGPALTARTEWYEEYTKADLQDWLKVMIKMLEAARPGDIFVVSTGNRVQAAAWGELMSNAAQSRGAGAAVLDGAIRDVPRILSMKSPFPVFAKAFNPADAKGRLRYVEYDIPVDCASVRVNPEDIIFGDLDGVVCIPRGDAPIVIQRSEEKLVKEDRFRHAMRRGVSVSEAFARYRAF